MPKIIAIGSGKGGVGKSVLSTNIAYLLASSGLSVTLLDMDSGGADLHILMGLFKPRHTLTDFIQKRVASLDEIAEQLHGFNGLRLISGTGDSLHSANMPAATREKLLRHIRLIKSDLVIIDVGAGTHFNTLDFFNTADIHLCVTSGDPTAILDLYRFIKLSVIRRALSSFLAYDQMSQLIRQRNIVDVAELLAIAEEFGSDKKQAMQDSIDRFRPCIVFNQVDKTPNIRFTRLQSLLQTYLGLLPPLLLGRIPDDPKLRHSVKAYHPVTSLDPAASSSVALQSIAAGLQQQLQLLETD